jgi:hypothetical protein
MDRSRKDIAAEKRYVPEMARKKKRVMRAVVPRIVFSTLLVGVVPACVATACGGGVASSSTTSDAGRGLLGVADATFSVAAQCFAGSTDPACPQLGVAAVAFQCFDGSTQPSCPQNVPDAADADDAADGDG